MGMVAALVRALLLCSTVSTAASLKYSTWMLESIISRKEGIEAADGLLSGIQKGIFQEAIRAAINSSTNETEIRRWTAYHDESVGYNIGEYSNATADSLAPIDRLCAARSLIESNSTSANASSVLTALRKSVDLQLRNADGGYWYYVNPPTRYYTNLSYSDGMYGFAPFATLYGLNYGDESVNIKTALQQLQIIYQHTLHKDTGLIVHGYDASQQAPWADPVTGASPEVWGRSLAWYTTGLVDALAIAETSPITRNTSSYEQMRTIFRDLAYAEIEILGRSAKETGYHGVWQVVDKPGQPGNFVEASASAMLVFALLKGLRYGYFENLDTGSESRLDQRPKLRKHFVDHCQGIYSILNATYHDILDNFVVVNSKGQLEYHGTSAICSLQEPTVSYNYYIHRPIANDSLIGESAFVLASLEMEWALKNART